MDKWQKDIIYFSLIYKFFLLALQMISNEILPDHDAGVFNPPFPESSGIFDSLIDKLFGGLRRWDAVYFLHIANHGYTYENCLAFFPLFPLTVYIFSSCLYFPFYFIFSFSRLLLLTAVSLNMIFSVLSSLTLYNLGKEATGSQSLAFKAALLYILSPASVFFMAPYSESLFSFLSFTGMLLHLKQRPIYAALLFGFSALARSNGIVALGFILHWNLQKFLNITFLCQKKLLMMKEHLKNFIFTIIQIIILVAPFFLYQLYTFLLYCKPNDSKEHLIKTPFDIHVTKYGHEMGFKFPDNSTNVSEWCHYKLPISYSFIQKHYWNTGFLRYFHWKQIPNFLLASPMICLCLASCYTYFKLQRSHCLFLGLTIPRRSKISNPKAMKYGFSNMQIFVFGAQMLFFTIFGFFCIHVQVLTRLIASSCPFVYWFSAYVISINTQGVSADEESVTLKKNRFCGITQEILTNKSNDISRLIIFYYLSYCFIGTIAFSNFLPWT
ncbi:GPI mannosyltransferase 2 [Octopus bimaculoides]|nr:GPI mannosyltransferase 2 [Octopus bimaculoides]|eukprot:XP_014769394.1 PREDICTED: GPI mannosyltransferase 2-like [Octopus bimaculoides]